jgi:uncharacterized membrane protein
MMGRLFWLITAGFLGLTVHLATILYFPGLTFQHRVKQVASDAKSNTFFLMKPEVQASLVATATAEDVVGLCLLDVSAGKVALSARMPRGQWALTIYGASGEQVYGLNDVEAGTGNFTIELSPAKSILEQLRGKSDKDEAGQIENVGWHAELNERRGVAVLWAPVTDPTRRAEIEAALSSTRCEKK